MNKLSSDRESVVILKEAQSTFSAPPESPGCTGGGIMDFLLAPSPRPSSGTSQDDGDDEADDERFQASYTHMDSPATSSEDASGAASLVVGVSSPKSDDDLSRPHKRRRVSSPHPQQVEEKENHGAAAIAGPSRSPRQSSSSHTSSFFERESPDTSLEDDTVLLPLSLKAQGKRRMVVLDDSEEEQTVSKRVDQRESPSIGSDSEVEQQLTGSLGHSHKHSAASASPCVTTSSTTILTYHHRRPTSGTHQETPQSPAPSLPSDISSKPLHYLFAPNHHSSLHYRTPPVPPPLCNIPLWRAYLPIADGHQPTLDVLPRSKTAISPTRRLLGGRSSQLLEGGGAGDEIIPDSDVEKDLEAEGDTDVEVDSQCDSDLELSSDDDDDEDPYAFLLPSDQELAHVSRNEFVVGTTRYKASADPARVKVRPLSQHRGDVSKVIGSFERRPPGIGNVVPSNPWSWSAVGKALDRSEDDARGGTIEYEAIKQRLIAMRQLNVDGEPPA